MQLCVAENCYNGGFEPAVLSALTNEDDITSGFGLMGFWLHFRGPRGPQRCRDRAHEGGWSPSEVCVSWGDACSSHLCTHSCCFHLWNPETVSVSIQLFLPYSYSFKNWTIYEGEQNYYFLSAVIWIVNDTIKRPNLQGYQCIRMLHSCNSWNDQSNNQSVDPRNNNRLSTIFNRQNMKNHWTSITIFTLNN